MGVACSCNDPCQNSWACLKTRLLQSAELRRTTRNVRCICSRPAFLRIRRRIHYPKKVCYNPKIVCYAPKVSSDCVCSYRTRGTVTGNDCLICAQDSLYKAVYMCDERSSNTDCKYCAQDVVRKYSKSCCTEKVSSTGCSSGADSPELSGPKNLCRFTVDAYFK